MFVFLYPDLDHLSTTKASGQRYAQMILSAKAYAEKSDIDYSHLM